MVDAQLGVLAETRQLFATMHKAEVRAAEYPGWMFWKRYPTGRTYLVHAYDRQGRGTTLGGQTPENAQRLEQFKQEQQDARQRLKITRERMTEHGRYIKAARLNRFPRRAAAVLRALDQDRTHKVVLVDAYALFAYELLFGVLFSPALLEADALVVALETEDRTALPAGDIPKPRTMLAELLARADRSFVLDGSGTNATSQAGQRVVFLERAVFGARQNPHGESAPRSEHAHTPTIRVIVIDQDGWPLEVSVPDPRAFAADQSLIAKAEERSDAFRERSRYLAEAVAEALHARKPTLPPLEPFPNTSGTAKLGTIRHNSALAEEQE